MIIKIISSIKEIQKKSEQVRNLGKKIAFVPTMGFLHEGHLKLLREGKKYSDELILSIFVNPTQFSLEEDLNLYPKNLERDFHLAENEGVNIIFIPENNEIYTENFQTYVELTKLPRHLCGLSRPMHFKGVATVITKLFNIVKPHVVILGEKDFQQLAVIRQMVIDLNFDIEIIGVPTVREKDGLAMSSRNSYLTPDQRLSATSLSEAFNIAQELIHRGNKEATFIIKTVSNHIHTKPDTKIDYICLCNPETLDNIEIVREPALLALAVKVGKIRLIDNKVLLP